MRPMESVHDLIDEAKVRAVWWCLCIFGISYFLSHTSKSMWTNIPISVLILFALRYLSNEVEIRWKLRPVRRTFLSHLLKEQISLDDPRLSPSPPIQRWTRKIDSPHVETAVHNFTDKILQDFVVDLWYATITPDKEGPELIRALILDAIGEISGRIKEINIVDLLTRDMVELVGNHLDLFRKNQAIIGVEVMGTLSSEERDERLKYHLMVSKELHPALMSPESEYKVLQRLIEGVLAVVLDPKETPLVRCISRELLTSLVMEPVMNFASPGYINELIELVFLDAKDETNDGITTEMTNVEDFHNEGRFKSNSQNSEHGLTSSPSSDIIPGSTGREILPNIHANVRHEDSASDVHPKSADWARVLDAATQHRTQVLAPENLENMWAKGRHYQKKAATLAKGTGAPGSAKMASGVVENYVQPGLGKDAANSTSTFQDKHPGKLLPGLSSSTQIGMASAECASFDLDRIPTENGGSAKGWDDASGKPLKKTKSQLKRSSSTSDLRKEHDVGTAYLNKFGGPVGSSELFNSVGKGATDSVMLNEGSLKMPKIKCRVVGAYFEKSGSNSFAVYSIAVTDAESKTWFVKRRYRNFERLHRHLKDIPNYTLHLPPKRFLSSSIDDYFVHQRCILLDKYLQDLLSIANVAEQHEVWDFLSSSSKNYSFGKSTSVMKTLAVNVDDAMDDIVRQFKGVSGGLRRIVGSPPSSDSLLVQDASSASLEDDSSKSMSHDNMDISHGLSDEEAPERGSTASGWHSDNELDAKCLPHRLLKNEDGSRSLESQESYPSERLERISLDNDHSVKASSMFDSTIAVPVAVPPEWTPPNVSVPILNLVDKIFQLNRRGWIRRQVFWISKQILQLMMEDAIDDWLLRQINWLRRDDVIAQGIRWVQDVLWPNGTFFIKLDSSKEASDDSFQENQKSAQGSNRVPKAAKTLSFEQQLEAARRASDVKKLILGGAPTTLVSLIGQRQYKRCAKDVYYFLQSTICIKQLAYGMLEVLLLSIFPELHDLILDINQGVQTHPT